MTEELLPLCECGCGLRITKKGNRFIHGHNGRGVIVSEEHRRKIGDANRGKIRSKETLMKMARVQLGKIHSEEHKKKISNALKGENNPFFGKTHSLESIQEMSNAKKGENNPWFGRCIPEEMRRKMSDAAKGENNSNWQGGISFEPYCQKFTGKLKQQIRDGYNNCDFMSGLSDCICNILNGKVWKLDIHHVDYNKMQGCDEVEWQLIPLSRSNHAKTNANRSFWNYLFVYALGYDKTYYTISDNELSKFNGIFQ